MNSTVHYKIVRYRYRHWAPSGELITVEQLADLARLHPDMVERLVDWGLLDPEVQEPRYLFRDSVVPRIWKIMRLRRDLGINWAGIGVVLDLLKRIEQLEQEVERLRKQLW
ncbi:MAG: chaperone modulator CbpM [Syntrophobacteria bacterium]